MVSSSSLVAANKAGCGSRSGKVAREGQGSESILDGLKGSTKLALDIRKCDAGVCEDVQALLGVCHAPPLRGFLHMTEQLRDKLTRNLLFDDMRASKRCVRSCEVGRPGCLRRPERHPRCHSRPRCHLRPCCHH